MPSEAFTAAASRTPPENPSGATTAISPTAPVEAGRRLPPIPPHILRQVMQDDWRETMRHVRLHPPLSFAEIVGAAVMLLCAAFVGFLLATGGI